eukprot:4848495-Pleurochrysis_carterae.AAC.1
MVTCSRRSGPCRRPTRSGSFTLAPSSFRATIAPACCTRTERMPACWANGCHGALRRGAPAAMQPPPGSARTRTATTSHQWLEPPPPVAPTH